MFVLVHGSIFEASGVMFDTSLWIGYLGGAPNRSCGYMMGTTSWLVLYSYGYISSIFEASGIEFDTSLWIVLEYLSARPNNVVTNRVIWAVMGITPWFILYSCGYTFSLSLGKYCNIYIMALLNCLLGVRILYGISY